MRVVVGARYFDPLSASYLLHGLTNFVHIVLYLIQHCMTSSCIMSFTV